MNEQEIKSIMEALDDLAMSFKGLSALEKKEMKFLKDMIAHHQMALKMAEKVMDSNRLKSFAEKIIDTQSKEIEQMQKWLKEWFNETSNMNMP